MDDRTIADACAYLGLSTGEVQDPARVALYVEALRDLKNEDYFVKAVSLLRDRCEHFPKIPEIRETYREVMAGSPSQSTSLTQYVPLNQEERAALAVEMRSYWEEKWGGGIGPATDPAGRCDDCHKQVEERWALGPGFFCRHCCTSRSKVKAKLDITGLLREMPGVEA